MIASSGERIAYGSIEGHQLYLELAPSGGVTLCVSLSGDELFIGGPILSRNDPRLLLRDEIMRLTSNPGHPQLLGDTDFSFSWRTLDFPMLGLYTSSTGSRHAECALFAARTEINHAKKKISAWSTVPNLGLAYYAYPTKSTH
jgi:hypothetical protein